MKKILLISLLNAVMTVQAKQQVKPVYPIQGFWVVENSVGSPRKQLVKFYDTNQQILYQEYYDRKVLNLSRKRVRSMLDNALITVLKSKNETQPIAIANLIGRKY